MKNKTKVSGKKGFTLLEVIIAIAVIGILSWASLNTLLPAKRQLKVRAAQTQIVAAIKEAQSYALQGKIASNGETPASYGFQFSTTQIYGIFSIADDGTQTWEQTFDLAEYGVSLTAPALANTRITFDIPHGNCTLVSDPLTLTLGSSGQSRTITVHAGGGSIEEN